MKIKSSNIRYPADSAVENHLLESMLPTFITNAKYAEKQIPKTKDFYKSDQFIWNNPHRTSKKFYKYFHESRDQGKITIEKMKELEKQDKQQQQLYRIQTVLQLRNQDLERMQKRKQQRMKLQNMMYPRKFVEKDTNKTHQHKALRKKEEQKIKNYEQLVEHDLQVQRKVQEFIKNSTLQNRQLLNQKLKKRHEENLQLAQKSGIKVEKTSDWTKLKFRSLSYTKSK